MELNNSRYDVSILADCLNECMRGKSMGSSLRENLKEKMLRLITVQIDNSWWWYTFFWFFNSSLSFIFFNFKWRKRRNLWSSSIKWTFKIRKNIILIHMSSSSITCTTNMLPVFRSTITNWKTIRWILNSLRKLSKNNEKRGRKWFLLSYMIFILCYFKNGSIIYGSIIWKRKRSYWSFPSESKS